MIKIEAQKEDLEKLQEQFVHVEKVMEQEIAEVKTRIYEEKRAKIEQLDNEVKRLLLLQSESKIVRKAREEERIALQMIWKKETGKLNEEKGILIALQNDLDSLDKDLEQAKANENVNVAELEKERGRLTSKIAKTKERIDYLHKERAKILKKGQKHVQNEREVLYWEVDEAEKDIRDRRHIVEERINELEAEEDIAADRLAEAERTLNNKIAEEDRKIHSAREQLFKHEEELLNSLRADEDNLDAKRLQFQQECKQRSLIIAEERRKAVTLSELMEELSGDIQSKAGRAKSEAEKELERVQSELEFQTTRLRELEENSISEEEKAGQLLRMANRDLKQKRAKNEKALEVEREQIERLKKEKGENLKEFEGIVNHLKVTLEDARTKLCDDKRKLNDLAIEEENLHQKVEDTVVSIAQKISRKLPDDAVNLEYLISELDEVSNNGRVEVAEKKETVNNELGKLDSSRKYLEDSVLEEEKEKQRIEDDLKEMREAFLKDRNGEKMELIQFVQKVEAGDLDIQPGNDR